jgi:hypothetical protein
MSRSFLLLAFGFGNILMLGWLAAAAAPILIHLWNKRRYREVPWAAVEYLLAALRKNSRRMRLEQWLLLLVRTLIVMLLVFAVAQPFLEQLGLNFVPGQRTLKVLVVDGSYSMGYKPTDKSRFERAKQLATQIVEESSQGDAFTLVLMASPPSVIVGSPSVEPREFLEEIENLKLPHGGGDLPATLVQVEQILQSAEHSGLVRSEVYFFTDLGRNSWVPDLKDAEAADYRRRLERLAQEASLVVIDLDPNRGENLAVTGIAANEPFATTAREATFSAQVRNFGTQPRNHHLVELHVDGQRIKEAYVDVTAGEQTPISFSHRFDTPGDHVVEVRLGPDLLDIDNHRWLSVPVKDHLRVLCVNGKPASGGLSGATDYVALALNPDAGDTSVPSVVQPEVIPESSLLERDLTRYDCIFLCNVAQFTSNEARVLENVLKHGGGLVFFLGDQVLADRYNRELGGEQGVRVLPAQLKELVSEAQYHFDPLNYRHPLVSVFQGREQAGLLTTPVYKYFRLALADDSKARVALAFDGGDPAIVDEAIHKGRSILIATEGSLSSVDPISKSPWTTMPAWPSFVPIVQEILALAVRGQMAEHNLEVGQTLGDSLEALTSRAAVTVTSPGGAREAVRMTLDAQASGWSFSDTRESGVYHVELGAPLSRQEAFAVNVDTTSESDLTKVAPDELPKEFTTHKRADLDESDSPSISRRSGLHKNLLYCVLGLLFAEVFLAWRFGHTTR